VLLSVTSDANQNPQSVDMAMRFAGFGLEEGRKVVIFFNVKGVTIPTAGFPDDFAFGDGSPIKQQLTALIERGADVHVCPICMKALDVDKSDLIDGAKVTTRSSLFAQIGPSTVAFTY
jgi:predicted peroxiredoxin